MERAKVTLRHTDTIAEALQVLAKNNILSAPVVVPAPEEDDSGHDFPRSDTLIGFLDVSDLLRAFIASTMYRLSPALAGTMELRREALKAAGQDFAEKRVLAFVGNDGEVFSKANLQMTLREVVTAGFLALGPNTDGVAGEKYNGPTARTVHRLAVFGDTGSIINIVSQTDVIRHLYKHAELQSMLGISLKALTVEQAGMCEGKTVACVPQITPTHAAFASMYASRVSAVGVLNEKGQLIGNLSASDLRRILPEHFSVLALPVAHFIAVMLSNTFAAYSSSTHDNFMKTQSAVLKTPLPKMIVCQPETPVLDVLKLLATTGKHRIYVVNAAGKPLAVITATDILRYLCSR